VTVPSDALRFRTRSGPWGQLALWAGVVLGMAAFIVFVVRPPATGSIPFLVLVAFLAGYAVLFRRCYAYMLGSDGTLTFRCVLRRVLTDVTAVRRIRAYRNGGDYFSIRVKGSRVVDLDAEAARPLLNQLVRLNPHIDVRGLDLPTNG